MKLSKSRQGSALLIVVAFLAMFTILVLGFLSRAAIDYQVSDDSTNLSGGDFFSQGAIDCIVGDLKQEIVDGSTSPGSNIYLPKAGVNMDPSFSGISPIIAGGVETDGLNNVLKVSVNGKAFYTGSAINRASSVTTSTPSLDNRMVALATWNKPLLMPATSLTNLTPTASGFPTPDWVYVARDGSNPGGAGNTPTFGLTGATVNNASPSNSSYVVGRYAYVIYNEGGLLDVNAAGSPDVSTMSAVQNQVWTRKGSSAFADLTQLPGMNQQIADSIIGWRNLASAGPTPNFPTYTFAGTPITKFLNNQIGQTTSGMTTGNSALTTSGQSDRMFTSRQQLISYLQSVGSPQQPLQYLGTFSRSLNQPSYAPPAGRPVVTGRVSPLPGPLSSLIPAGYTGGNSAYQYDNIFNPVFRSVQVTTPFIRNDGSIAVVGEPLVKKRFALNRLCWLTYKGPSANLGSSDPLMSQYLADGVSQTLLNEGTAANIYQYFGLAWTPGPGIGGIGGYWTYNHGIVDSSGGAPATQVGLLSDSGSTSIPKDVMSALREPDFFELLKAGVCCGAIAKTKTGGIFGTVYSAITESTVTFQILQLGANIITQASPSQYPIWIRYNFGDAGGYLRNFYGSTDLPYFYSDLKMGFITTPSVVSPGPWPPAPFPLTTTGSPSPQSITTPGQIVAMIVPTIWDPYDVNGPGGTTLPVSPSLAPSNLRITVVPAALTDPTNIPGGGGQASTNSQWRFEPRFGDNSDPQNYLGTESWVTANWKTEDNTAMLFANQNTLYRQPTVLFQPMVPAGSGLSIEATSSILSSGGSVTGFTETASKTNFIGWLLGTCPQSWSTSSTTAGVTTTQFFSPNSLLVSHPGNGSTIRLEYQAGASWIPYQEIYICFDNDPIPLPITETADAANPSTLLPVNAGLWSGKIGATYGTYGGPTSLYWWGSYAFDPRSTRWGAGVIFPGPNFTDVATVNSERPDGASQLIHLFGPSTTGEGWTDISVGFNPFFFATNMGGPSQNLNTTSLTHYGDPDGVVRRAMGGLVSSAVPASTVGLPMATPPAASSTPIMLHRPYRSVAELGYVFSDTPWRNIDFFTPESGYAPLLDLFCINEDYRQDALTAGKVDLNTRQAPVVQALLAGAYRDESAVASGSGDVPLGAADAANIAKLLLARTAPNNSSFGQGPLTNIADLVGHYVPGFSNGNGAPYSGFSADLVNQYSSASPQNNLVQRFMETSNRALSDAGQVGTWNLLIDVVAQSGKCSATAQDLPSFLVKGERHYWVHVAIDRQSGQVIDESIEPVNL